MKKYKVKGFKEYHNKIIRMDTFIIEAPNIALATKKARKKLHKNYVEMLIEEIGEE